MSRGRRSSRGGELDMPASLGGERDRLRYEDRLAIAVVASVTLVAFAAGLGNGFVNWDDNRYILDNPLLTLPGGLGRIWSTFDADQYYPLTFTSYWLEYRVWGTRPTGYYVVNMLLHAANAALVYLLLRQLGLRRAAAFMAACLFGVSPVQVQSVSWLAERKNTLSGFFALAAAILYLRSARPFRSRAYFGALVAFALAILSKTSVIALPLSLVAAERLVLDKRGGSPWARAAPMLVLAAIFASVTIIREDAGTLAQLPWALRPLIAASAVFFYLGKLCFPYPLVAVYPPWPASTSHMPYWIAVAALVIAVGGLLWLVGRRSAILTWAAAHFAVMLLPVLGLVRFDYLRLAPVADHLVYLASIGVYAALAFAVEQAATRFVGDPARLRVQYVAAGIVAVIFVGLTWRQLGFWRDGVSLWSHTLRYNPSCSLAHNNLGAAEVVAGRPAEAVAHYRRAIELDPGHWLARTNLGVVLRNLGRLDEAVAVFRDALRLAPSNAAVNFNLAYTLALQRHYDEAIELYRRAIRLNPAYGEAITNLGIALREKGQAGQGIEEFQAALRVNPDDPVAHFNLGIALAAAGRPDDAMEHYRASIRLQPRNSLAHTNLGVALVSQGKLPEAMATFNAALEIDPNDALAHLNVGAIFAQQGKFDVAERHFSDAARLNPASAQARNNLGTLLAQHRRYDDAIPHLREAVRLAPQHANAHFMLGFSLAESGRAGEAAPVLRRAIELSPEDFEAHFRLAQVLEQIEEPAQAVAEYRRAVELKLDWFEPAAALAWILVAHDDADIRNPEEGLRLAERLAERTERKSAAAMDLLAAAYAAAGRFDDAIAAATAAQNLALTAHDSLTSNMIEKRIQLYRSAQPFVRSPSNPGTASTTSSPTTP